MSTLGKGEQSQRSDRSGGNRLEKKNENERLKERASMNEREHRVSDCVAGCCRTAHRFVHNILSL